MRAPGFYFEPPGIAALLLSPLAVLYGAAVAARMRRSGKRAQVPVICVGNLTLGGAGKTPTALALAKLLAAMGERPVFLSRGYGGSERGPLVVTLGEHDAADVGDEPLLLARAFPTVVARDRVAGAALAVEQGASVLVLDDGFQSPDLEKDLALLVIDAASGIGNGAVFPAGPLRAPLEAQLGRAHAIVCVGAGGGADLALVQAAAANVPAFAARLAPDAHAAKGLAGRKVLAFAGIGHPEKFFATLRELGAEVVETRAFGDHHRYSAAEAADLLLAAKGRGLQPVTTEKDLARMQGERKLAELATATKVLAVRLEFLDAGAMRKLLEGALAKARAVQRSLRPG
ncbi:MAG TPA: tetraacyldisaccharide 4'-kinase [Xanthobacteraceae bacterium]|jgi:tetraacyldisaccharide 4'-kinase